MGDIRAEYVCGLAGHEAPYLEGETLEPQQIARLMHKNDKDAIEAFYLQIKTGIATKELPYSLDQPIIMIDHDKGAFCSRKEEEVCVIHRDDMNAWLKLKGINVPIESRLFNWLNPKQIDNTEPKKGEDDTKNMDTYTQRKIAFNKWLSEQKGENDFDRLDRFTSVRCIFDAVKVATKDDKLKNGKPIWPNKLSSFNGKDFWHPYCREISYSRKK